MLPMLLLSAWYFSSEIYMTQYKVFLAENMVTNEEDIPVFLELK